MIVQLPEDIQDRQFMMSEVKGFFRFACERIGESQAGPNQIFATTNWVAGNVY